MVLRKNQHPISKLEIDVGGSAAFVVVVIAAAAVVVVAGGESDKLPITDTLRTPC